MFQHRLWIQCKFLSAGQSVLDNGFESLPIDELLLNQEDNIFDIALAESDLLDTDSDCLPLMQRITESLLETVVQQSKPLQYGKYKSGRLSTLEDFAIAEWRLGETTL